MEQIIENARSMGFQGVELRGKSREHIGPEVSASERAQLRQRFNDAGVEVVAIMGYSKFVATDKQTIHENVADAVQLLDLARDLGCPILREFIGQPEDGMSAEQCVPCVVENLKPVIAHAEQCGVKIALETHDAWTKGESIRGILDAVKSPALGICWDVCNSYFEEPLSETFAVIGDRVIHVHFKDGRQNDEHVIPVLPGEGNVDLAGATSLLNQAGYTGYYSFEWEKWWHRELPEPEVALPHYINFCSNLK